MTPSPIAKVLSTIRKRGVRALLMGGQACILYGAAEFSRDVDLAVLADPRNLRRLEDALRDLDAEPVYLPPMDRDVLLRGHACHFRAQIKEAFDLRIDVMAVMRGCDPFDQLWRRRRRFRAAGVGTINVLALADLVQAKKTQRDKDWPMIRRLVEADYLQARVRVAPQRIAFWLREGRTAEMLIELCGRFPTAAARLTATRPLLRLARADQLAALESALRDEEIVERAADRAYWQPLREELFAMRQRQRKK